MRLLQGYLRSRSALLVALALVAVATFSALAPAQTLDTVGPGDGTIGTVVTLTGSGFGEKPPKVWLSNEASNKTWKLKVLSTSDTEVVAEVRKVAAGLFDVNLRPKGKGQPTYSLADAFEVFAPAFDPLPATVASGAEVELTGEYFGSKKPKVKLGGKKVKLLEATGTSIRFVVNGKLPDGLYTLELKNKVGEAVESYGVRITGSETPLFKQEDAFVGAKVDGKTFASVGLLGAIGFPDEDGVALTGSDDGSIKTSIVIGLPIDPPQADTPPGAWLADPSASITLTRSVGTLFPEVTTWTTEGQGDDFEIVVMQTAYDAESNQLRLSGFFSAELVRTDGELGKATASIKKGEFSVDVEVPEE